MPDTVAVELGVHGKSAHFGEVFPHHVQRPAAHHPGVRVAFRHPELLDGLVKGDRCFVEQDPVADVRVEKASHGRYIAGPGPADGDRIRGGIRHAWTLSPGTVPGRIALFGLFGSVFGFAVPFGFRLLHHAYGITQRFALLGDIMPKKATSAAARLSLWDQASFIRAAAYAARVETAVYR